MVQRFQPAKRAITITLVLTIVFVILAWVIPVVVASAVFVAFAGVFSGPIFPLMITVLADVMPGRIQFVSMTIATAFGTSGGALFSFLVGVTAEYAGSYVLFPFTIALFGGDLVLWLLLPNPDRVKVETWWQRLW
ncbi:unnamed protein product [Ambrosiozyma monospora]|uniref:Unnamed protein product n=1 Tax=Ambrosiozyma monospora TaxID=43982 RepID=A0ACB5TVR1_AMBMO|nr:unnamed protein product [Ambrosiozyma monospora]